MTTGGLFASAATLIQLFDLDEGGNLSKEKRVAGYFLIVLICLVMSVFLALFA